MAGNTKLKSLEAGRAIAAISVVLFHVNGAAVHHGLPIIPGLGALIHGVDFFFIISGFIIFHVHRNDIGQPGAAREFAIKRFIRLYPILWLVAGSWIALRILTAHDQIGIPAMGTSLLLYPSMIKPCPDVIWTLRHELLFYAAFFVLVLAPFWGRVLFGIWTGAALVQLVLALAGRPFTGLPSFFLSSYELDFVAGAAVAALAPHIKPGLSLLFTGVALVIVALVAGQVLPLQRIALNDYTTFAATSWVVILGLCFAVLLLGLVAAEKRISVPDFLVTLGGSSYALYLVHVPIQQLLAKSSGVLPGALILALSAIVPIAVAHGLHVWFERPMGRWLRANLARQNTPPTHGRMGQALRAVELAGVDPQHE